MRAQLVDHELLAPIEDEIYRSPSERLCALALNRSMSHIRRMLRLDQCATVATSAPKFLYQRHSWICQTMTPKLLAPFLALLILSGGDLASAADMRAEAVALQRKAAASFVALRETFRGTFQLDPLRQELATADAELAQSTATLQGEGLHADVAAGLFWRGELARLRDDADSAAQLYALAAAAAERGSDAAQQTAAWAGKARAELTRKQPLKAAEDARRAIALAPPSGSDDALSAAYGVLTFVHTTRGELDAANQASRQQFATASRAHDPVYQYQAYSYRALLRMRTLDQCDPMGDIVPCLEAFDAVFADMDAASALATRLRYVALATTYSAQRADLARIRSKIERRER